MNKIFRVVWNHATQSWVAVSELTKAHKKSGKSQKIIVNSLIAITAGVAGNTALAANYTAGNAVVGNGGSNIVAIGENASARGAGGISIGENAGVSNAAGNYNTVIGRNARVGTGTTQSDINQSTAIGGGNGATEGAWAKGDQSIAIGGNTRADGDSSIAIGGDDVVKAVGKNVTYTNKDGKNKSNTLKQAMLDLTNVNLDGYKDTVAGTASISLGMKAQTNDLAVAIGTAAEATKVNTVALGTGAKAGRDNAVAIGGGSNTEKAGTKQSKFTHNSIEYSWAGGTDTLEGDIVSFGSEGYERQLKNVAAGEVSQTSTDAINGSQLYGIVTKMLTHNYLKYAGDDGQKDAAQIVTQSLDNNKLNILGGADKNKLSDNNIGVNRTADGTLTVKLAKDLTGLDSAAIGGVTVNNAGIAMGDKKITGLKAGEDPTDAVNKSQLDAKADQTTVNNISNNVTALQNRKISLSAVNSIAGTDAATNTNDQTLSNDINFKVKSADGELISVAAAGDTITITPKKGKVNVDANGVPSILDGANTTDGLVEASELVEALEKMGWKATSDVDGGAFAAAGHTKTAELIKAGETVTFKAGDNLTIKQAGKNFTYALAKELKGLTSVTIGDGSAPAVKLDADGLSNGNKNITNVAGNLDGAKEGTTAPEKAGTLPTGNNAPNQSNAATVGDVLNAGWNLQGNKTDVDFVKPYDTVNFINGDGTEVEVKSDDQKTSTIKVKVKAADNTLTVDASGVKVNTGTITPVTADNKTGDQKVGQVTVPTADAGKIATVGDVANAINAAAWNATSAATASGENSGKKDQAVKAGDTVTFEADKNIKISQTDGKFTFATKDNVEFTTVKVGDSKDGKAPVEFKTEAAKPATNNADGKQPTTALNIASGEGDNAKPTQLTGVGSTLNTAKVPTNPNGTATPVESQPSLVNLTDSSVNPNAAATVGDLQNMGWVVSTKEGDYKDVVKNANEVQFVGTGIAKVTGKTDEKGIRTITVNVDEAKAVQSPVVYTKADGTKLVEEDGKFYEMKDDGTADKTKPEVAKGDVIASLNSGDNSSTAPTTLGNVKSNLPETRNTADATDPNAVKPITTAQTAPAAADLAKIVNNAATVGDVLNAGWNLQGNGQAVDFVKPYDTVNFVNGKGTTALVSTNDNLTSRVTFNVDAGEITSNSNGSVTGPSSSKPEEIKTLKDNLKAAQDELAQAGDEAAKKAAQEKIDAAEKAIDEAGLNKVATAQNVADMINNSGFTLKAGKTEGENTTDATLANGEVINPGDTITMQAGKNMTVKHEKDGTITYATKDDVEFNSVKVGGDANTYVDDKGNPVTKDADGTYKDANGQPVDESKVSPVAPVTMKTEAAKPATNNADGKQPTTALNIASGEGDNAKPTQLTGVASTLNITKIPTNPNGTATPEDKQPSLVDLVGTEDNPVNSNAAATVGDLQNMGWVVSTKDGNGYVDTVKNANQVDFVGKNGITVTGATGTDGVRTITVEAAQSPVVYTTTGGVKVVKGDDGNFYPEDSVKIGDKYYPAGTVVIDGKPYPANTTEDQVKAGTATEETPYTAEDVGDVIASLNDGSTNDTNTPMTLGNVKSNLPQINDKDKTVVLPGEDPADAVANPDNVKASYITAEDAADLLDPNSDNFAGNNAATVSDVLNAGWNLQGNGEAVDFVKPFDTVNFVDGGNTTVSVSTDDNLTSKVQVNVTGLPITYTTSDGTPVVKVGDKYFKADKDGKPTAEEVKPAETPLSTNLVNPNASNTDAAPNAQTTTPTQLGNVANGANTIAAPKDADGNDLVKANDGNWYKAENVNPNGTVKTNPDNDNKPFEPATPVMPVAPTAGLIDFAKSNPNNAATVGDLQNMGWVVSTKDGNGYTDQVRNANQVDFKGEGLATVTGKTLEDGTRQITVSVKTGEVVKSNEFTTPNGDKLVKVGDNYYNAADIDPTTGEAKPEAKPVYKAVGDKVYAADQVKEDGTVAADAPVANITNNGAGLVTGNQVADAIQIAGFVIGKQKDALAAADYKDEDERVNPDDNVRFADGNNTSVKLATKESVDASGKKVTTTTVKVDVTGMPVQYTTAEGTPVTKVGDKFFKVDENGNPTGDALTDEEAGNLVTNVINPAAKPNEKGAPTTLGNVKSNLPHINDADKKVILPGEDPADAEAHDGKASYIDAETAADLLNPNSEYFAGNNAATVSDVLNAGWNLQGNGEAVDFVKPFDTVNFVDGKGTKAVVSTDDNLTSRVTFNVDAGEITSNSDGSVTGPSSSKPEEIKTLKDNLKAAQDELAQAGDDAAKKAAQDKIDAAEKAIDEAGLNKVATAQNVADMINNSGFTLKTSEDGGKKVSGDDEVINPGDVIDMAAGKNLTVKQDANGKVTYATADDVEFNSVKVANPNGTTYTDENGKPVVKADDGKFYPADQVENGKVKDPANATPVDDKNVTAKAAPAVEFKAENATPASNNGTDADKQPTTALNIASTDNKPTQLKGVGSVLNTGKVDTAPAGKDGETKPQIDLVNLGIDPATGKPSDKPLTEDQLNSAATVRDLANMGWVVSTQDGNGYVDTVKNANKVDFKGEGLATVTGKTLEDGTRQVTVSVKTGEVVKSNEFTTPNGDKLVKVGDNYYNAADIDPTTGEAKPEAKPVYKAVGDKVYAADQVKEDGTVAADAPVANITNNGAGLVTGNQVADAIQAAGFVIGKQTAALTAEDYKNEDERVNPDDNVRFADGNNTSVKLATKESVDASGKKVTTTTVKVDVTGMPVQYTTAEGTPVTKVGDKFFKVDENGNPTGDALTDEEAGNLVTNVINPTAKPNEKGAPTTLGNVKNNLPQVNDVDATVTMPDGTVVEAAEENITKAPMSAQEAADIVNTAGNNAATVSDVLNTGWNLQNNGEAKDFVKPYDSVNFVNGKGTKAVVETDGYTSNVKFDVDAGNLVSNANGSVTGPVTAEMNQALADANAALKAAQDAEKAAPMDPAAQKALKDAEAAQQAAQNAVNNANNQVATAQNVADAINNSGFTLTTSANGGAKLSGSDELINPGKKVDLAAGKNMTVKQDADGKVTYATADDVQFNSVQLGDANGPKITANGDNINVGKADGAPTKITGVAAGDITPTSNDAVNGAQIYALSRGDVPNVQNNVTTTVTNPDGTTTEQTLNGVIVNEAGDFVLKTYNVQGQKEIITNSVVEAIHNMNEQGIKFFHSNDGVERAKVERENSFDSSASGKFATAIGSKSSAEGTNAVAIGYGSVVKGNDSISIGTGNQVNGNNSGAFGDPSIINGNSSYSVGNNNTVATDHTFVLGNNVTRTAANSVFLGTQSGYVEANLNADGSINEATSTTAGTQALTQQVTGGVVNQYAGGNQGEVVGVVSVGTVGQDANGNTVQQTRRIQNVAPALLSEKSTDAVNGSQLYSVASNFNNRLGDLNNKVNRNNKDLRAGIAGANAAAGLPQVYIPGKSMVAASAGTYKGQSALAVGYSRASDNGKVILKLQGNANTRGDIGGSIGVGYQW